VFGVAWAGRRSDKVPLSLWLAVAGNAFAADWLIG